MRTVCAVLLLASLALAQDRATQIFNRWDKNGDGKLTREELPAGVRVNFDRADTDRDGSISRKEHQAFLRKAGLPDSVRLIPDVRYADTDNPRQRLDLYLPKQSKSKKPLPVVVFIHGGGWRNGDKAGGRARVAPFVASGEYAAASIGYRLSGEAIWPAQIHDCKAAIRWLRGNAQKHGLDPDRIGVWGTSAGGHLVALLGVSGDVRELEGKLGKHLDQSSRVACVVDFFGPTLLGSMPGKARPGSAESLLLGGLASERPEVAKQASAVTHASRGDAPFLILHGTNDRVVPYKQSELLQAALEKAGVPSLFVRVEGGGHGFRGKAIDARVRDYFALHLLRKEVTVTDEAVKPEPSRRGLRARSR